jgi:membrane associated rhomboid family serine protease
MSQVEMHPFEAVLRMCADAAPNAWHPERYARRSGVPLEKVNAILKQLWYAGLLEKGAPHPEDGPGLRLSAKGWEVLNDRQALRRLCANDGFTGAPAPRPGEAGGDERTRAVRDALRHPRTAHVGRVLLAANVLVFAVGLYLASQANVSSAYLSGSQSQAVIDILHRIGMLTAADWLRGEWWKALTACFVHIGALHILMNMYMLYNVGRYIESIWGPWRFLAIYLVAGLTGSMTGLAASPVGIAGASTSLCGIFAAEGVWVLFNGRYLPAHVAREWRNHLLVNALLLVFISLLPGISFWGHAGGAAAGAAAAVCLHYHRFGPPLWRWAALLGLLPIPLGGLYMIDRERHHQKRWATVERVDFEERYKHNLTEPITKEMVQAFAEKVRPVLVDTRAERRDEVKVEAARAVLAEQRQELESWQAALDRLGPYVSKDTSEKRQAALDALKERIDLYARMEECLQQGERFPARDEKELMDRIAATPELQRPEDKQRADAKKRREQEDAARNGERPPDRPKGERTKFRDEVVPALRASLEAAHKLYHSEIAALVYRDPAERVPQTVKRVVGLIDKTRKQLDDLEESLARYKSSKDDEVRAAARRSQSYATMLAGVLDRAKLALDGGKRWAEGEKKETEGDLQAAREEWQGALEALGVD